MPTLTDLCVLLQEAEQQGFVHKGTHHDVAEGHIWDMDLLGNRKSPQIGEHLQTSSFTMTVWKKITKIINIENCIKIKPQ